MFIGALEENLVTQNSLIASHSFYHDVITWCIQRQKPIPIWKSYFYICKDPIVYVVGALEVVFVIGLAYFAERFERHPKWDIYQLAFNGVCAYVGFSCTFKPTFHITRFGFFIVLFAAIVFTTTKNSMLIVFITSPIYDPQIQSIQEIVSRNFNLMGDPFALYQISQQNEVNLFN